MFSCSKFLRKKRELDEVKIMTKRRTSRGVLMFFNREKEMEEIRRIVSTEPNLITFVYGPINSGKTELMQKVADELPENFAAFYINLRGEEVVSAENFFEIMFDIREEKTLEKILERIPRVSLGIPIAGETFKIMFESERKYRRIFRYITNALKSIKDKGKTPILIFDELQVIKDVKIDDFLIYKLFNFFVHLTKELHLAHVFAVTSDSLFIEKIYSSAMLHGRARYILVDDFSLETAKAFLRENGFSDEEIKLTLDYFGGKPIYLVEAVKNRHRLREFCENVLEERRSVIIYALNELKRNNKKLYRDVYEILLEFKSEEEVECRDITEAVSWCIDKNILFLNPRKMILKPQSKLDLIAVREIV